MATIKKKQKPLPTKYDLFASTSFQNPFRKVQLAKQVALIIAPVIREKGLGLEITGGQCYLENKVVREPDDNPYEVDIHADPMSNYRSQLQLTVLLPSPVFITKFRHMIPSIEEALQKHGIVSVRVRWKVVPEAWKKLNR